MLWKTLQPKMKFGDAQNKLGYVHRQQWTAPPAANATLYLSAQSLASGGTVTSFLAQPVVPRNVQIVASGATTASITINGTDIRGIAISLAMTLNGSTPVVGTVAFASITSIVLPTVAGTTLNVGTGAALGLDRMMAENSVICTNTDGTKDGTAATVTYSSSAISANTVTTNTAPNGTHNFAAWFATIEITELTGTTS